MEKGKNACKHYANNKCTIVQFDKKYPNLLTPDPNICYNELATVRVEIFGSGAVLIALTIGTAFYFAIYSQKQHPFQQYSKLYYTTIYSICQVI